MKTCLWLLGLGLVIFLMYRRAHDYGLPWEQQVVIANYEHGRSFSGDAGTIHVTGEVRNETRKRVQAEIQCKTLPGGMTITPKASTTVDLGPLGNVPFNVSLTSRSGVTGAECKVERWRVEDALDKKLLRSARQFVTRVRHRF